MNQKPISDDTQAQELSKTYKTLRIIAEVIQLSSSTLLCSAFQSLISPDSPIFI